jgi:cation transport ATPase
MTGESMPVEKAAAANVIGGAINGTGALVMAAEKIGADTLRKEGSTALFVAVDDKPPGNIAVADPIKPSTAAALDSLRNEGIRIVMLTGDNRTTARAVASKLGLTEVEADVFDRYRTSGVTTIDRALSRRPSNF